MKKILLITTLLTSSIAFGQSGEKIAPEDWKDGEIHMSKAAHDRMLFISASDPLIEKIPVKDNGEPLVDLKAINHPRIKLITDLPNYNLYLKPILPGDIENVKKGLYSRVRQGLYERLVKTLDYLPPNIGIAYAFGYHDIKEVEAKVDYVMLKNYQVYLDKNRAYEEISNFMTIKNHHNGGVLSGSRIFMTLFDTNTNKILNLGIIGINPDNATMIEFSPDIIEEQRKYRVMLAESATKAGLVGYGKQWFTFSYGDKIWAYVTGAKEAIYDTVNKTNSPLKHENKEEYLKNFNPDKIAQKYEKPMQ